MSLPDPLTIDRVVSDAELREAIGIILSNVRQDAPVGGITIGLPRRPRALVYVGSLPEHIDKAIRYMAKPLGFNVSTVRNEAQLAQYETATAADTKGY